MVVMVFVAATNIREKKDRVSRSIFELFVMAIISVVANSVFVMSDIEGVAMVSHSMFLASIDWLLLLLLRYTVVYTENHEKMGKIMFPFLAVAIVETVNMILNPIFHQVFTLQKNYSASFGTYYTPGNYRWSFYTHLGYSYVLVVWILVLLALKCRKTARIYRRKYSSVLWGFILVIVFDAIGLMANLPLDISLIFYCLACLAIYFFSLYYVPKAMRDTILSAAVQTADMGVACFDIVGKCIYVNQRGKEMIHRYKKIEVEGTDYSAIENYFAGWLQRHWQEGDREKSFTERVTDTYRTFTYEFNIQTLYDEQDEQDDFIGHFITCIDRTNEYDEYEEAHYKATHDMLTGIYNEQYFEQKVVETLGRFPNEPYVMITSDIKDFKLVNDLFGTERGDEVLKMHAQMFRKYAGENVVYGRLAEDRFGFCMPKARFREIMFINIMKEIENIFHNDFFRLQIKMGVYEIQDVREPIFVMIDKCNLAISRIKDQFTSRVAYYDDSLFQQEMEKYKIINEFDGALNSGQFEMFLQAQTTWEGKAVGAEGLVRWRHPQQGLISPQTFIPVLENAGLIHLLDLYMWEQAVKQLAEWKKIGREDLHISVNISAKDQYHMDIYETLKKLAEDYEVNPKNLRLEITETIFITEVESHLRLVRKLQEYGFEIAIDDFGSGYSSLNILKDISANELKIDMVFLQETKNKERGAKIVASVIKLSKQLGMTVVVEGVETKEQVEMLKALDCDVYQGYYFAKPVPVAEFESRYM